MKKSMKFFCLLFLAHALFYVSCSKKETTPSLDLISMSAGNIEIDGVTPASNVGINEPIKAVFNTPVTKTSATADNIKLTAKGITDSDVNLNITVSGDTVIIMPSSGNLIRGMKYSLSLSNLSSGSGDPYQLTITFSTEGIGISTCPQYDKQVLYLQFDGNITDLTGNATKNFEQVAYTKDRFGNDNAAADFRGASAAGKGDIVELTGDKFISPSMTISFWIKVNVADLANSNASVFGLDVERGYALELEQNLQFMKYFTDHIVNPDPKGHQTGVQWADGSWDGGYVTDAGDFTQSGGQLPGLMGSNQWDQIVMTFDASTRTKRIYVNGTKIFEVVISADDPEWALSDMAIATSQDGNPISGERDGDKLALGYFCSRGNGFEGWADYASATNTFKGQMDDFRIWTVALAPSEVTTLYNSEKP